LATKESIVSSSIFSRPPCIRTTFLQGFFYRFCVIATSIQGGRFNVRLRFAVNVPYIICEFNYKL